MLGLGTVVDALTLSVAGCIKYVHGKDDAMDGLPHCVVEVERAPSWVDQVDRERASHVLFIDMLRWSISYHNIL